MYTLNSNQTAYMKINLYKIKAILMYLHETNCCKMITELIKYILSVVNNEIME